jgi:hypothetical protein
MWLELAEFMKENIRFDTGFLSMCKFLDSDQIGAEPELENLLRSPGIDSKPGGDTTPCLTYCI